jgi:signal peptidase I
MEKTVRQGEGIIVDTRAYQKMAPSSGDLIVFRRDGTLFLKRLVVKSGHTIIGYDRKVFVDGNELDEPYVYHIGILSQELDNFGPVYVPAGKLFVMGDNRDLSLDSRTPSFGLVDERALIGKALYVTRAKDKRQGTDLTRSSE